MSEPICCGLCLYGSDIGVPGYDDKGPAYINPECRHHNPEAYETGEAKPSARDELPAGEDALPF